MNRAALALTIVAMGGFPAAMSHGVVISLGEASFTASLGEAPTRHWIDEASPIRIGSIDALPIFMGDVMGDVPALEVSQDSGAGEANDFGSIDLLEASWNGTVTGDIGDLTAPAPSEGSTTSVGTPLASQGADPKGMPSTSESESGGFAPPDSGLTEDGRNLLVGPHSDFNGTAGTDLTPISVPGSGIAVLGSIAIAGFRRRR